MIISWKSNAVVRGAIALPGRSPYPRPGVRRPWRPLSDLDWPRWLNPGASSPWVRPAYRRRALKRRRLLRLLATILVLTAASGLTIRLATRMDSVVVLARREMPSMPEFFYQEDPAWGADTLGASDKTLGKGGDGVACLTSLLAMQQMSPLSGELNPGTLNAWLSANDAYDASGNLNWSRVAELLGAKTVEVRPRRNLATLMEALIQREVYPIVTVRRPDTGTEHQVLAVGTVHGEFVIVDPLDPTGIPNSLSLYGNRIYGLRYLEKEED